MYYEKRRICMKVFAYLDIVWTSSVEFGADTSWPCFSFALDLQELIRYLLFSVFLKGCFHARSFPWNLCNATWLLEGRLPEIFRSRWNEWLIFRRRRELKSSSIPHSNSSSLRILELETFLRRLVRVLRNLIKLYLDLKLLLIILYQLDRCLQIGQIHLKFAALCIRLKKVRNIARFCEQAGHSTPCQQVWQALAEVVGSHLSRDKQFVDIVYYLDSVPHLF